MRPAPKGQIGGGSNVSSLTRSAESMIELFHQLLTNTSHLC